jgi:HSP20 family protein
MNCNCAQEEIMNTLTKNPNSAEATPHTDRMAYSIPRVDIVETPDAYCLEAEMPGVNKEGLEVLVNGDELTIRGRRAASTLGAEYRYRESNGKDYRRAFTMSPAIDTAKISVRMEKGILTLLLPKSDRVKPRTVAITD